MRDLAVFEKYIDSFAITPEVVRDSGFRKNPPDFHCIVAEETGKLVGMLVYYFLPYTAQNRPAVYMKELFVSEGHRGHGVGRRLMDALRAAAKEHNCAQIKWTVAPWNQAGVRFYEQLGAKENRDWLSFDWNV
ncbi:MAG: GNAT family N-acetyltransferase [Rhodanobacteraceae bacterium]|nr:MAG: GNAT family N-acetyltransferase [Rhodanobacteraceae bacterium]